MSPSVFKLIQIPLRSYKSPGVISGSLHYFSFLWINLNPQCDPAYTANMFMDLLSEQPNSLMVFGAACSDVTEILAEMSAYRNLAQVCYFFIIGGINWLNE